MEYQQQSTRKSGAVCADKTVYAGKTVYASFGKGVSSKCCSFKLEQEQQCFEGVQPQVRARLLQRLWTFRQLACQQLCCLPAAFGVSLMPSTYVAGLSSTCSVCCCTTTCCSDSSSSSLSLQCAGLAHLLQMLC